MKRKPVDRRKLAALLGLFLILVVAFGLSLTTGQEPVVEPRSSDSTEQKQVIQNACASSETFNGLKQLVFEQAGRLRTLERVNFDILAASAVVRMEDPVVRGRDETLDLTRCSARFILELPPGAEAGFNGERRLVADTVYEVQMAADGSGPVYRMAGAEQIISRLASFDMLGRRLEPPSAPAASDPFAEPTGPPEPGIEPVAPSQSPSPSPAPADDADPRPEQPRAVAEPSFDCRYARTRGELLVCGSARLAAQDRRMAALYGDAMDEADRRTRRQLVRTRDNFLAYRDRCRDAACVAQAYEGRMREIRDIMDQSYRP